MKITDIEQELERLKKSDSYRAVTDYRMKSATRCFDRGGKEYIVFSSNNYLGLTHNKSVIAAARKSERYGSGSTGARLTSGAGFELSEFEKEIALFKGMESALVFNSGYMANLGVLYALAGEKDVIFSDSLNHASIVDGCRISRAKVVVYKHNDMNHLEELLKNTDVMPDGQRFIVSDGVFSMDGDIVNLPELIDLKQKYDACLMIDEAHSFGVIGSHGGGTPDYYGIDPKKIDIHIGTMSKALGAVGGYVVSSKPIIELLKNKSRPFIFSTSIPPSVAGTALKSLKIIEQHGNRLFERLHYNTNLMRGLLKQSDLKIIDGITPIIPIITGDSKTAIKLASYCHDNGILLCPIRPPSVPEGTSRIRLTVTAAHSEKEIQKAAAVIKKFMRNSL